MSGVELTIATIKIVVILFALLTAAAYLVLLERWIAAWVQDRRGPNRVGIPLTKIKLFGLGQPLADGLKFIFKEEYTPAHVDRFLYTLAPISILVAAILPFAVIPFGSVLPAFDVGGELVQVQLILAPKIDVAMIFVFAMGSVAVYGVILGGWASNNKYSFLGALRSSAQLIAYELPLGLGILGVVLATGSLRLEDIIDAQATSGTWNVLLQPLGFLVFLVASFAESARLPFDLPEAEQELIGGYHTEYSALRLLMYLIAEFLHMVTSAFLIAILFFGGWHFWGLTGSGDESITWVTALVRVIVLLAKVMTIILFFMMVRWSWPRFRFDQLMALAWKVMLPLGMVNLVVVAVLVEYENQVLGAFGGSHAALVACLWALAVAAWLAAGIVAPLSTDNRPRLEATDRL
jgi:NADH-quinone oxidoreductase subunit H